MKPKLIHAIASSENQVNGILRSFLINGSYSNDISVRPPQRDFAPEKKSSAPRGAAVGAGVAGLAGAAFGLLAGIANHIVNGVEQLVTAGPYFGTLFGLGAGMSAGGIAGGLIAMGRTNYEAKLYSNKITAGKFVLSIRVVNRSDALRARKILNDQGVEEISLARLEAKSVPGKPKWAVFGSALQSFHRTVGV